MTHEQIKFIEKLELQGLVDCYMENKEILRSLQASILQSALKISSVNVIGWTKETKIYLSDLCEMNKEINFKIINLLEQMKFIQSIYYSKTGKNINY